MGEDICSHFSRVNNNLANLFISILSEFVTFSNILGSTKALEFLSVLSEYLALDLKIAVLVNVVI